MNDGFRYGFGGMEQDKPMLRIPEITRVGFWV